MQDSKDTINSKAPISDKKIQANCANSKKSTGPKTDRGKRFSSRNAWRHGLSSAALIPGEFLDEHESELAALRKGLRSHFKPVGWWEETLVDKLCCEMHRMRRAVRYETAILTKGAPDFQHATLFANSKYAEYFHNLDRARSSLLTARQTVLAGGKWEGGELPDLSVMMTEDPIAASVSFARETLNLLLLYMYNCLPSDKQAKLKSAILENIDSQLQELDLTKELLTVRSKAASDINALKLPSPDEANYLLRCKSDAERSFSQALDKLERAQALRKGTPVAPPAVVDVHI